eukprot:gb/GECH01014301.1/.p1 GENE.gb/GECH01014301.1/~~gb/GECH01014301.1/.p1  ORF type:complete len:454 (+),score=108.94 gb/GECH01014301.1/:1-1362(+)
MSNSMNMNNTLNHALQTWHSVHNNITLLKNSQINWASKISLTSNNRTKSQLKQLSTLIKSSSYEQVKSICDEILKLLSDTSGSISSLTQSILYKDNNKKISKNEKLLKKKIQEFHKNWDLFQTIFEYLTKHQQSSTSSENNNRDNISSHDNIEHTSNQQQNSIHVKFEEPSPSSSSCQISNKQIYVEELPLFGKDQENQSRIPLRLDIESIANSNLSNDDPGSPSTQTTPNIVPHSPLTDSMNQHSTNDNQTKQTKQMKKIQLFNSSPSDRFNHLGKNNSTSNRSLPQTTKIRPTVNYSTSPSPSSPQNCLSPHKHRFRPILPKPSQANTFEPPQFVPAKKTDTNINQPTYLNLAFNQEEPKKRADITAATVNRIEKQNKTSQSGSLRSFFEKSGAGWWLSPGRPLRGFSRKKRAYDNMIRCFRVETPTKGSKPSSSSQSQNRNKSNETNKDY